MLARVRGSSRARIRAKNWSVSTTVDERRCCRRLRHLLLLLLQLGCCGTGLLRRGCLCLQLDLLMLQLLLLKVLLRSPLDRVLGGVDNGGGGDEGLLRLLRLRLLLLQGLLMSLLLRFRLLLMLGAMRLRLRQMLMKMDLTSVTCHGTRGVSPRGARATPARALTHDHLRCVSGARHRVRHWWTPWM